MREDLVPAGTAQAASILAQWPAMSHFYLAGGTALALHPGRRQVAGSGFFHAGSIEHIAASCWNA
jgi:hypothetical protein